jgi:NlpC/P60 family putative phage cell wall peptidase
MATRAEIVTEARAWLGTRFHHQGSKKNVGCDCIGLIRGVGIACGIYPADFVTLPEVAQFHGYGLRPSNGQLEKGCEMFAMPIALDDATAGDFVLMAFEREPCHLAILGDYHGGGLSLIHAYAGVRKVIEHVLSDDWRARIVAAYAFPGVE